MKYFILSLLLVGCVTSCMEVPDDRELDDSVLSSPRVKRTKLKISSFEEDVDVKRINEENEEAARLARESAGIYAESHIPPILQQDPDTASLLNSIQKGIKATALRKFDQTDPLLIKYRFVAIGKHWFVQKDPATSVVNVSWRSLEDHKEGDLDCFGDIIYKMCKSNDPYNDDIA